MRTCVITQGAARLGVLTSDRSQCDAAYVIVLLVKEQDKRL